LADEWIADRKGQSLIAKKDYAIQKSKIYREALKSMATTADTSYTNTNTEEVIKEVIIKPHQPRFMSPLCNVTASSASGDLLVIHTPTDGDDNLSGLIDSGATKKICSDSYARETQLITHPLQQPLRIRLADGTMSLARYAVGIQFYIGTLQFNKEFIVTRLQGPHQIILGYEFLKEINPSINWVAGTLSIANEEAIQAIISKRVPDVKHLSAKQMARLLKKEQMRKNKLNKNEVDNDELRTYIGTIKHIVADVDETRHGIQGHDESMDVTTKINNIESDFGGDNTMKL
jgi:hypothetical protein